MIQITKPIEIPDELIDENAQKQFESIIKGKFVSENNSKIYRKVSFALFDLYYGKCCYCESKLPGIEIEHYRPKSKYYWLAYSWDNLLPVCSRCNKSKGDKFPIKGSKVKQESITTVIDAQNQILKYNEIEKPVLINPEIDEIDENSFTFEQDGFMSSNHERLEKTITILQLNSFELLWHRKKVFDELISEIIQIKADNRKNYEVEIKTILRSFIRKADNRNSDYLAFRKFIIKHWLQDLLSNS